MCGTGKLGDAFTSGFEFPFTTNPTKWDNEYFVNLERYQVGNHLKETLIDILIFFFSGRNTRALVVTTNGR